MIAIRMCKPINWVPYKTFKIRDFSVFSDKHVSPFVAAAYSCRISDEQHEDLGKKSKILLKQLLKI